MKDWKDDARRLIVSEKKELETFPGYWVKLRKYSVQGSDEIMAALRNVQKNLDKKSILEISRKAKELGLSGKNISEDQVIEMITPEQLDALVSSNSLAMAAVSEAKIKFGVAEHNFCEGDSTTENMDIFAHDILEYAPIAKEIVDLVEGFNRPLAMTKSETSDA